MAYWRVKLAKAKAIAWIRGGWVCAWALHRQALILLSIVMQAVNRPSVSSRSWWWYATGAEGCWLGRALRAARDRAYRSSWRSRSIQGQSGGIQAELAPPPRPARPGDVGAVLLAGPERLFLYVSPIFSSA